LGGLGLGWFVVEAMGQASFIQTYFPLFYIPKLDLVLGVIFAVALGFVAGVFPAYQAMRLRLADALRREG
jgi:putative ABC transport system permease protein